ncbi:MAG: UPF0158 family protein [Rikenellaceae bacterium]
MKIPQDTIKRIAEDLDCGMICIINLDTGEYETLLGDSYDSFWDDDDPLREEITEKTDSWENSTTIEPPHSGLSFRFMEQFTEEIVREGSDLQESLYKAISKGKPFRNFKAIIDCSDYRQAWFTFKAERMIEYVNSELPINCK